MFRNFSYFCVFCSHLFFPLLSKTVLSNHFRNCSSLFFQKTFFLNILTIYGTFGVFTHLLFSLFNLFFETFCIFRTFWIFTHLFFPLLSISSQHFCNVSYFGISTHLFFPLLSKTFFSSLFFHFSYLWDFYTFVLPSSFKNMFFPNAARRKSDEDSAAPWFSHDPSQELRRQLASQVSAAPNKRRQHVSPAAV